jgi:hypothetical protein
VFGVTGHRDLRDEDVLKLERYVQNIFFEFKARYPDTPMRLITPLAEGADRLAARAALETGVRLIVPLPMSRKEYEKDFSTPASISEFSSLLSRADECLELPLAGGNTPENIKPYGEHRDRQYAQAGAYIAGNCHILIALWDGARINLPGGTSDVVTFKTDGLPGAYRSIYGNPAIPGKGPVYHLVTPRKKNPKTEAEPFTLIILYPSGGQDDDSKYRTKLDEMFKSIDRHNRDVKKKNAD